jgi:hypothetical protein
MVPVTFETQVTAEYNPDGAGRHLANLLQRGSGMDEAAGRAVPGGEDLDAAIEHARAALAALLRAAAASAGAGSSEESPLIAEARALLATLLDHRIDRAAPRLSRDDATAVAAIRADRDEAIAVSGALLYWLPSGDPAWPEVALTVGRLSYDRYRDPWPLAGPPDPDDLDAACDLLLCAARYEDPDEHTTLYLVQALRDRQRLLACPSDTRALAFWGERLRALGLEPRSA